VVSANASARRGDYDVARHNLLNALIDEAGTTRSYAIYINLASVCLRLGRYEEALKWAIKAREQAGESNARLGARLTSVEFSLAQAGVSTVGMNEALDNLKAATSRCLASEDLDEIEELLLLIEVARAESAVASVANDPEQLSMSSDLLGQLSQLLSVRLGAEHPDALAAVTASDEAAFTAARISGSAVAMQSAIRRLSETSDLMRSVIGEDHPQSVAMMASIATAQFEVARLERSISHAGYAVAQMLVAKEAVERCFGASHPRTAAMLADIAIAEFEIARHEGRPDQIKRALVMLEEANARTIAAVGLDSDATVVLRSSIEACRELAGQTETSTDGVPAGMAAVAADTRVASGEGFGSSRYVPIEVAARWLDVDSGNDSGVPSFSTHEGHMASRLLVARQATGAKSLRARQRAHRARLAVFDALAVAAAVGFGYLVRFQGEPAFGAPISYTLVSPALILIWLIALRLSRTYDDRVIGYGAEEYRRILATSGLLVITVMATLYMLDPGVSRGFLAISFATGMVTLVAGRMIANKVLHRARARGLGWSRRVLVVGDAPHLLELLKQLQRGPFTGYQVVGACIPDALWAPHPQRIGDVPVIGTFRTILSDAAAVGADTVAVTASGELTASRLRRLGWQLEATDIDLVVAPALTDVAGPRIHLMPVAGLPMIHVEAPEFRGGRKVVKDLFDRTVALGMLLLVTPLCLLIAISIKLDSRGPVLFRQTRIGRGGREFRLLKFRTMVTGAREMRQMLADHNETDGLLFKMRNDPRVTRVGRWLRKWSLDELPQLVNVVLGQMSLIGPRPPLPEEVARYDGDIARRLLVKPGITGLWQVSGRAGLSFEEGIRHDLYYVENWSLTMDLVILLKTVGAVLRGRGAY
jgi:exopolysaccharide biosynthesis polyprenyl glycosylphosphotransferase